MVSDHAAQQKNSATLLEVRDLRTYFFTDDGVVKAVDGLNFRVNAGEVFGIVGESGCGKSVTALSILRLIESPGEIVDGEITFKGQSLLNLPHSAMTRIRGDQLSMVFQQPLSSLDPVSTIGSQIAEMFEIHQNLDKKQAWEHAVELLRKVGISDAKKRAHAYPHQISGGQAQRVMIATALALDPDLLIADEPTTALDVTIQAQILDLLRDLVARTTTAVILITHDLGVIAEMADRVAVMYAGHVVEESEVEDLFDEPMHPYTQKLMASVPRLGQSVERLVTIDGTVPDLIDMPSACRFAERCTARSEYGLTMCTEQEPDLIEVRPGHFVRCWIYQDTDEDRTKSVGTASTVRLAADTAEERYEK